MQLNIEKGWQVLEDVHEFGDLFKAYQWDFDPRRFGGDPSIQPMAPWEPIPRLEYLQMLLSESPYYGRGLRQFNYSPWWYKNVFTYTDEAEGAVLRFEGVDYFADVWLNEQYLGAHEGYNTPFEFEVGDIIKRNEPNLLVVKVRAPWENEVWPGFEFIRFCTVVRDQMKGTYEHSDTFVPRDVNPIGIWNKVTVTGYDKVRLSRKTMIEAALNGDYSVGNAESDLMVYSRVDSLPVKVRTEIYRDGDLRQIAFTETETVLKQGDNSLKTNVTVKNPALWNVWERGDANLYTIVTKVIENGSVIIKDKQTIGFRDIKCVRNEQEMYYVINGNRIYLRGTTYFPDIYISNNHRQRYLRDIEAAKKAGMNVLRIHVHAENEEFYDLCDRMGMLLVQDSDFNWIHPQNEEWGARAAKMFEEMIVRLKNHASIFCWVLLNEARADYFLHQCPGPQFTEIVKRLDPNRCTILDSWNRNDPDSGDSHNYMGSLDGAATHYADIYGTYEKFNTEFGCDALPVYSTLRRDPDICRRIDKVIGENGIEIVQYYQYRYIKYFIEHYRSQKYAPCSAHFQFLFSDPAPTSHFGVYDWLGMPKYALRAYMESNHPIAFIMETKKTEPVKLFVINDLLEEYKNATAVWQISCEDALVFSGELKVNVSKDSRVEIADLTDWKPENGKSYSVVLKLYDENGKVLTENRYEEAFNPPEHVKGHPTYVDHGIGLRTYWQWMED